MLAVLGSVWVEPAWAALPAGMPRCIAHGGAGDAPDHSLAALAAAVARGARGLAVNVHHTADGVAVLMDEDRPGRDRVADERCDARTPVSRQATDALLLGCRLANGEAIPTLATALETFREAPIWLFLRLSDAPSAETRARLRRIARDPDRVSRLAVVSTRKDVLTQLARDLEGADPGIPLLHSASRIRPLRRRFDGVSVPSIRPRQVRALHDDDEWIDVYGATRESAMQRWFDAGVNALTTFDVETCMHVVGRPRLSAVAQDDQ